MKKPHKNILINLILVIIFFAVLEFLSYNLLFGDLNYYIENIKRGGVETNPFKGVQIRNPENKSIPFNPSKRPILFLGCSYTYGQYIKDNNTFSSLVQLISKRKTYNTGQLGFGPDDIYRILSEQKEDIFNNNPYEYVIYTYMFDHVTRYQENNISHYLTKISEDKKNNSFKDKIEYYLDKLYTVKYIKYRLFIQNPETNILKYNIDMYIKIINLIKEIQPDAKVIFLIYSDLKDRTPKNGEYYDEFHYDYLNINKWKKLEKYGYIVISTDELTDKKLYESQYKINPDLDIYQKPPHPNEKAWEVIAPALCKKFNL